MQIKYLLLTCLLVQISFTAFAQNNNSQLPTSINEDGTPPDNSAILDIQSANKGVLIPRMTYTEIKNIVSPAEGLMAYDTENHCLRIFNGSNWDCLYQKFGAPGQEESVSVEGGYGNQYAYDIDTDALGNIYVLGRYNGTTSFGNTTLPNIGSWDVFITKYDSLGTVKWTKNIGSTGNDAGNSIAVSQNGDFYVTGQFYNGASFDGTQITSIGLNDIFIAKYNTSGTLQWVQAAGGNSYDAGYAIDVDSNGDAYVTGYFRGSAIFGTDTLTASSSIGIGTFVVKYSNTGTLLWTKGMGDNSSDNRGQSLIVDNANNVYVTGYFNGTISFGTFNMTSAGSIDIFLAKYDSNGNPQWARQAGGPQSDWGYDVALDDIGYIYVVGYYSDQANFDNLQIQSIGNTDAFITKYDNQGNAIWAKRIGGGGSADTAYGVAIDANGNPYVTGVFQGLAAFDNGTTLESRGQNDIFIAKCDSNGNVEWIQSAGSNNGDSGESVTKAPNGDIYVTGTVSSIAFFGGKYRRYGRY